MTDIVITLAIPEELAHNAEQLGLLSREHVIELLQNEISRRTTITENQQNKSGVAILRKQLGSRLKRDDIGKNIGIRRAKPFTMRLMTTKTVKRVPIIVKNNGPQVK